MPAADPQFTPLLKKTLPDLVRIRRHLHQHPEFSHQEFQTSALMEQELKKLDLDIKRIGKTAIMATIHGGRSGKTVGLRGDMDALKITEETGLPYASTNGYMHACGHDGHTTMLLGAARLLAPIRKSLRGTVKLFFQPAEEGGGRGGLLMCNAGVMKNPKVDAVFALHGSSSTSLGSISLKAGTVLVCSDGITLRIIGRGGHAAGPHLSVDPIVVAARIIDALQTVISREQSPMASGVVTLASIHGGSPESRNVIPNSVDIVGTIRAVTFEQRDEIFAAVKRIATLTARAHRARCIVTLQEGLPPTVNDPAMTDFAAAIGRKLLAPQKVLPGQMGMGGEDFSYFLQRAPGAFIWLGIRDPKNKHSQAAHHNPHFDFNDKALPIGIQLLATLARNFLNNPKN